MADPRLEPLVLSEAERRTLDNWAKRRTTGAGAGFADPDRAGLRGRRVQHCRATRLGVNRGTVARWRARFLRDRLDGLSDEPRPGMPRTITDA